MDLDSAFVNKPATQRDGAAVGIGSIQQKELFAGESSKYQASIPSKKNGSLQNPWKIGDDTPEADPFEIRLPGHSPCEKTLDSDVRQRVRHSFLILVEAGWVALAAMLSFRKHI